MLFTTQVPQRAGIPPVRLLLYCYAHNLRGVWNFLYQGRQEFQKQPVTQNSSGPSHFPIPEGSCFTVSLKLLHSIAMAARRLTIKDEPAQLTEPTKNLNLDPGLFHVPNVRLNEFQVIKKSNLSSPLNFVARTANKAWRMLLSYWNGFPTPSLLGQHTLVETRGCSSIQEGFPHHSPWSTRSDCHRLTLHN